MNIKDLKPGVDTKLEDLSSEEHKTTPPGRFSEPSLVGMLESKGIGRPSTFSSIVSLIQDRGYVAKKGGQLYPTALGFAVARLLSAKFPTFTDYSYTAQMETELEEIADGKQSREGFLSAFWNGKDGFEEVLEALKGSIDFEELEQYSVINLHNGYSVKAGRFGTFLQDDNATPNEKGYLPSARLEDDADVWDYRDAEKCRELLESAANRVEARELGVLAEGEYEGYTLWVRDGKFGPYLQALHPKHVKLLADGKKPTASTPKPINQSLPEKFTIESVELDDVKHLFAEVKLPRTLSPNFFVGHGARGPWLGQKSNPKARRAVFVSLPEGLDPRTMTLEDAEKVWQDKQDAKKAKADKSAAKKPATRAKKTPAKPKPKK